MGQIQAFAVAFLTSLALLPTVLAAELCQANQSCWPSVDAWSTFNTSIGGQLVAPHPPGWACHDPNYDEIACNDFKANWNSSFWRANQTGAMQNPIWDSLQCSFGSPRDETCDQGFVPYYSVDAQSDIHVIEAVKFADRYNLSLVVKSTGHDYLGRSSGAEGSFSIWTHNLRGIDFTNSFVASGCSQNETALPAVTVKAAEQWLDVYKAADAHNVSVVGATARSVGAAGGWVQGGGHSMLSGLFGMGVDNVLQFTLVKPDGQTVLVSKCQNQDLFWALCGGGGSTWGVALDVTYKTHPPVNVNVVRMILNATNAGKIAELSEVILGALPGITDQGIRGYGVWGPPTSLMVLLIHPNSSSLQSTNNTLRPIYNWINNNSDTEAQITTSAHPTFYDMFNNYIQDPSIGVPIWFGTRLVSREAFAKNSKELLKYIWGDGKRLGANFNIIGGGAVSRVDPELTSLNPQWRKDAIVNWIFGGGWAANASAEEIEQIKSDTTQIVQRFSEVAGLDDAAYFNEADPLEPQWKKSFFGSHYDRLLKIKQGVDPKGLFRCNRCVGSDL
ncbi:FAD-binding domain protein [Rhizoctonia solani]|uniref:FAD-binding domain protein n=1 Tax=Rhizoctonia solani TaxID=456999 RepID=A0A8H8P161_9AGAM|nr:FAD-binding domain protein [Rhizoctonia solani]QRW23165.1 FAD-binding domain protein [Rhizoctonia solani]